MALASVTGVVIAALRQAGLMTNDLEVLIESEIASAAAAQSEQAAIEWERVITAIRKIAARTTGSE